MAAPSAFDWVTERSKCSIEGMFSSLLLEVKSDVEVRESISKRTSDASTFAVREVAQGAFMVVRRRVTDHKQVDFLRKENEIEITGYLGNLTRIGAGLTLNEDGECVFVVDGKSLVSWQLRRIALDALFFD